MHAVLTAAPNPSDVATARELREVGIDPLAERDPIHEQSERFVRVPTGALRLVEFLVGEFAEGRAVTLTPDEAEVTSAEAARILRVSRPHLIKLLDSGGIEYRRVGTHRRIRLGSLLAYQAHDEAIAGVERARHARENRERRTVALHALTALDDE